MRAAPFGAEAEELTRKTDNDAQQPDRDRHQPVSGVCHSFLLASMIIPEAMRHNPKVNIAMTVPLRFGGFSGSAAGEAQKVPTLLNERSDIIALLGNVLDMRCPISTN